MSIEIVEIEQYDASLQQAFERLVPQLSEMSVAPSPERLQRIVASPTTHLLAATTDNGTIVGVLTLVFVEIPTGYKAWIEDVVTDLEYRGLGIGQSLVERALSMAEAEGVKSVNLTSRPSRQAAHALYRKVGFKEVDTTVFRR